MAAAADLGQRLACWWRRLPYAGRAVKVRPEQNRLVVYNTNDIADALPEIVNLPMHNMRTHDCQVVLIKCIPCRASAAASSILVTMLSL